MSQSQLKNEDEIGRTIIKILKDKNVNFETELHKYDLELAESSGDELGSLILSILQHSSQKYWIDLELDDQVWKEPKNFIWAELTYGLKFETSLSILNYLSQARKDFNFKPKFREKLSHYINWDKNQSHELGTKVWVDLRGMIQNVLTWFQQCLDLHFSVWLVQNGKLETIGLMTPPDKIVNHIYLLKNPEFKNLRAIVPRHSMFEEPMDYGNALMDDLSTHDCLGSFFTRILTDTNEEDLFDEINVWLTLIKQCKSVQELLDLMIKYNAQHGETYPLKFIARLEFSQEFLLPLKEKFTQRLNATNSLKILRNKKVAQNAAEKFRDEQEQLSIDKEDLVTTLQELRIWQGELDLAIETEQNNIDNQATQSGILRSLGLGRKSQLEYESEKNIEKIQRAEEAEAWIDFQISLQTDQVKIETFAQLENSLPSLTNATLQQILEELIVIFGLPNLNTPLKRRAQRNSNLDKEEILQIIKKFFERPKITENPEDKRILEVCAYNVTISQILPDLKAKIQRSKLKILEVRIVASRLITIDSNILLSGINLLLCAPKVKVEPLGGQELIINTSGVDGAPHFNQADSIPEDVYGVRGNQGSLGNPGQSAGHVVITSTASISNLKALRIVCNGGNGGKGQKGGKGAEGKRGTNGEDAPEPDAPGFGRSIVERLILEKGTQGTIGERGGNGGLGGCGGLGGSRGNVEIQSDETILTESEYFECNDGGMGAPGEGGEPGIGGIGGIDGIDQGYATRSIWFWDGWSDLKKGRLQEREVEHWFFPNGWDLDEVKSVDEVKSEHKAQGDKGDKGKSDKFRSRSQLIAANQEIALDCIDGFTGVKELKELKLKAAADKIASRQEQIALEQRLDELRRSDNSNSVEIRRIEEKLMKLRKNRERLVNEKNSLEKSILRGENGLNQIESSITRAKQEENAMNREMNKWDSMYDRFERIFSEFIEQLRLEQMVQIQIQRQTMRNVEVNGNCQNTSAKFAKPWTNPLGWDTPVQFAGQAHVVNEQNVEKSDIVIFYEGLSSKLRSSEEKNALENCLQSILLQFGTLPPMFRKILTKCVESRKYILGYEFSHYIECVLPSDTIYFLNNGWVSNILHLVITYVLKDREEESLKTLYMLRTVQLSENKLKRFENLLKGEIGNMCAIDDEGVQSAGRLFENIFEMQIKTHFINKCIGHITTTQAQNHGIRQWVKKRAYKTKTKMFEAVRYAAAAVQFQNSENNQENPEDEEFVTIEENEIPSQENAHQSLFAEPVKTLIEKIVQIFKDGKEILASDTSIFSTLETMFHLIEQTEDPLQLFGRSEFHETMIREATGLDLLSIITNLRHNAISNTRVSENTMDKYLFLIPHFQISIEQLDQLFQISARLNDPRLVQAVEVLYQSRFKSPLLANFQCNANFSLNDKIKRVEGIIESKYLGLSPLTKIDLYKIILEYLDTFDDDNFYQIIVDIMGIPYHTNLQQSIPKISEDGNDTEEIEKTLNHICLHLEAKADGLSIQLEELVTGMTGVRIINLYNMGFPVNEKIDNFLQGIARYEMRSITSKIEARVDFEALKKNKSTCQNLIEERIDLATNHVLELQNLRAYFSFSLQYLELILIRNGRLDKMQELSKEVTKSTESIQFLKKACRIIDETAKNELKFLHLPRLTKRLLLEKFLRFTQEPTNFEYIEELLLYCTDKSQWEKCGVEGLREIKQVLKYLAIMIPSLMLPPEELLDLNGVEIEPISQERISKLADLQSKLKPGFSKSIWNERQAKEILFKALGNLYEHFAGLLENHKKRGTGTYKFNSYFNLEKIRIAKILQTRSSQLIEQMTTDLQIMEKFTTEQSTIFLPSNYLNKCAKVLTNTDWIKDSVFQKVKSIAYEEIISQIDQSHKEGTISAASPPNSPEEDFIKTIFARLDFYTMKFIRDIYNLSGQNQLICQLQCLVQSSASDLWKHPHLIFKFIDQGFQTYGQDFVPIAQVLTSEFQNVYLPNKSFCQELSDGFDAICNYSDKERLLMQLMLYIRVATASNGSNGGCLESIVNEALCWKWANKVTSSVQENHHLSDLENMICALGHIGFSEPNSAKGEFYRRLAKCLTTNPKIFAANRNLIYNIANNRSENVSAIANVFGTKLFNEEELKYWEMLESADLAVLGKMLSIPEPHQWVEEIKLQLLNKYIPTSVTNSENLSELLEMSRDFAKQEGEEFYWFRWMKEVCKSFKLHKISNLEGNVILVDILSILSSRKDFRFQDLVVIVQSKFPSNWSSTLIEKFIVSSIQNILEKSPNHNSYEDRDIMNKFKASVTELMEHFHTSGAKKKIIILFGKLLRQEFEEMSKYSLIHPQQIQELMDILANQQQPVDEISQLLLKGLKSTPLSAWKIQLRKHALLRKGLPLKIVALCQDIETKVSAELIDDFLNVCEKFLAQNSKLIGTTLAKIKSSEFVLAKKILERIRRKCSAAKSKKGRENIFVNSFEFHMERIRKTELKGDKLIKEIMVDPINQSVFPSHDIYANYLRAIKGGLNRTSIIQPNQSKIIKQWNDKDISSWAKKVRAKIKEAGVADEADKVEILSVFLRAVKFIKGYLLYDAQIVTILGFLNHTSTGRGLLGQISTGEGKTIVAALTAIYWGLCGKQSNIITSSTSLAVENYDLMMPLFELFGVSVGNICDAKCRGDKEEVLKEKRRRYKNAVLYGDLPSFQGDILRTEFFGEEVTGGREPDFIFVDEVDSMLLDKGGNVLYISHPIPELMDLRFVFIKIWSLVHGQNVDAISVVKQVRQAVETNQLKVPASLKDFVKKRLEMWVKNAFEVKDFPEDDQYRQGERSEDVSKIIVIDKDTGEEQESTQFSYAVQQFLQLRHYKKLTAESLKAVFMSNLSYFQKYPGKVFGMTGTLGSVPSQRLLAGCYNVDFFRMPRNKIRKCVEEEGIVCSSEELQMSELVNQVQTKVMGSEARRSILFICENVKSVKKIKLEIVSKFPELVTQERLYTYESAHQHEEFMKSFKDGVRPGIVIIGTNLAGRGMDLKISPELDAIGGLHVVLTYMPSNSRIEEQAFGRTARAGGNGSVQFIIWHDNPDRTIAQLQYIRDEEEMERLNLIKTRYLPKNECEEMLFKRFTALYTRTSDSEALKNLASNIKKKYLECLNNRWAFWLDSVQENLKLIHTIGQQGIIEEYEKFEQECTILANGTGNPERCLASSSQDFVALALEFEKNGNLTEAIVLLETAICKEPELNEIPHYYLAGCHLKTNGKDHEVRKKAIGHLKTARKCIEKKISSLDDFLINLRLRDGYETPLYDQILNEIEILKKYSDQIEQGIGIRRIDKSTFSDMPGVLDETEGDEIFKALLRNHKILSSWKISQKVWLSESDDSSRKLLFRGQPLKLDDRIGQYQKEIFDLLRQKLESGRRYSMSRTIKTTDFAPLVTTKESFWEDLTKINFFSELDHSSEIYVRFDESTYVETVFPNHLDNIRNSLGLILKNQNFKLFDREILYPLNLNAEDYIQIEQLLTARRLLPVKTHVEGIISPEFSGRLIRNRNSGIWEWKDCPPSFKKFPSGMFGSSIMDSRGTLSCRQELLPFCWDANRESACEEMMKQLIKQGIVKECKVNYSFTSAKDFNSVHEQIEKTEKAVDESKSRIRAVFNKYHPLDNQTNLSKWNKTFDSYIKNIKARLRESIGLLRLVKNVEVKYTKLQDCFKNKEKYPLDEITDFHVWNFGMMMMVDEKQSWWTTRSFIVTMFGITQLAIAAVILVASGGTLFNAAMILGSEGISDIFYARMNKDFGWWDFAGHKVFSVGASFLTGGLDGLFPTGTALDIGRRVGMELLEEAGKEFARRIARDVGYRLSAWGTQKALDWVKKKLLKNYKDQFISVLKKDSRFQQQLTTLRENLMRLHAASYQMGQAEKFLRTKESIFVVGEKSEIEIHLLNAMAVAMPQITATISSTLEKSKFGVLCPIINVFQYVDVIRIAQNIIPLVSFTRNQVAELNQEIEVKISELNRQRDARVVAGQRSSAQEFESLANIFVAKIESDITASVLEKLQKGFAEPAVNAHMALHSSRAADKVAEKSYQVLVDTIKSY